MAQMVQVTVAGGIKIFVNLDQVTKITPVPQVGSHIDFVNGDKVGVTEQPHQIK